MRLTHHKGRVSDLVDISVNMEERGKLTTPW